MACTTRIQLILWISPYEQMLKYKKMKKLKKLVLNELRQENYILSSVEQQAIQGGGSGTAQDPYTMYEFENWNGPWNGGFVDGFGFVSSEAFVYGNRVSCYKYEDHFIRYDMVEGSGLTASFTSTVSTAISGGMLNVGACVIGNSKYNCCNGSLNPTRMLCL